MKELIIFIIALVAAPLYWRTLFFIAPYIFDKPFSRTRTGLQIHHAHYGILFVLIANIFLIFDIKNNFIIALLGLGLGLILDEFIPSLLMPGERGLELEIYKKSFLKTILLFLIVIIFIFLVAFLSSNFNKIL